MSLFSTLKSLFGGGSQPQQTAPRQQAPKAPPPKPAEPLVMPATTDKSRVRAPRQTTELEPGTVCDFLSATASLVDSIPQDIKVSRRIDLSHSKRLKKLPENLNTGSLILRNCDALEELPNGIDVTFLDIQGCTSLKSLPSDLRLRGGGLNMRRCTGVKSLPDDMGEVAYLDLGGCAGIRELPAGLKVTSWIDITGTGITALPAGFEHVGQRDNGKVVAA